MESGVKQRLKIYIEYKQISIREFERSCGLSNGYVGGITQTIMPNKLSDIAQHYPDLNPGWLLTGDGSMLKYGSPEDAENRQVVIVPHKAKYKNIKSVKIYNANATTGVVDLYNHTKDAYIVMRQCRHSDIKMTMIYLRSLGCGVNEQVRDW